MAQYISICIEPKISYFQIGGISDANVQSWKEITMIKTEFNKKLIANSPEIRQKKKKKSESEHVIIWLTDIYGAY